MKRHNSEVSMAGKQSLSAGMAARQERRKAKSPLWIVS